MRCGARPPRRAPGGVDARTRRRSPDHRAPGARRPRLGRLRALPERLPELRAFAGGPVTTVVPSTTPAALTSITTGLPPSRHGITGFRFRHDRGVLNAIRWQLADGTRAPDPGNVQTATGVLRASGAGGHQDDVPHHRVHRRAPARRRVPRVADDVGAGRARAPARWPVARRSSTPTTRVSTRSPTPTASTRRTIPAELRGHRPARGRRCSTRCRPTPRWSSPPTTARCRSGRTAGSASPRCTRWSRRTRATAASATCTRSRARAAELARGGRGAPRRGRLGVPARAAARRGLAGPRPGAGHLPPGRRRRARGPHGGRVRRPHAAVRGRADRRARFDHRGRDGGAARGSAGSRRANVGELHPCDSSTGPVEGPVDGGEPEREERTRWPSRSCISTCTPSSRCSTARRASPRWSSTAAADGQPAVGITDHGNMYGVLDFYRAARDADLTPVIGTEAYMVTTSRHDRPRRDQHDIFHLTLLAESTQGYRNLIKVSSQRVPRRLLPEAPGRLRPARAAPRGARRHDRLSRWGGVAGASSRATTRSRASTSTASSRSSGATRSSSSCRTTASPSSCRSTRS